MPSSRLLSPLPTLTEISARLNQIFPVSYPDRTMVVGEMATRMVFVALYGGFIEGSTKLFRPSTITRFSLEQAALTDDQARIAWIETCHSPRKERIQSGTPWYADNTRESIRDDLIRSKAIPLGMVIKVGEKPVTSPAPIYQLGSDFAALFSPSLLGGQLEASIESWRSTHIDPGALARMRLLQQGATVRQGEVRIVLPVNGKVLRLSPGDASVITKDVCEVLTPKVFERPIVVHVSTSDQKVAPELMGEIEALQLKIDVSGELPDVVVVDVGSQFSLAFIEVVHSDGPITELRRDALLRMAEKAGIDSKRVRLISAFEDRNSQAFKRRVSELALGTWVWFRSEPDLIMKFDSLG
jgi:BsuBI/PstI restriction endonuclease domain/BsuBI/PstI restriction endonuclease HTH domain